MTKQAHRSPAREQAPRQRAGAFLLEAGRVIERLVSPALLLLLHQKNSYGYELLDKLEELGLSPDASQVYRHLRHLEEEGLLRSAWDTSGPGPARRVYKLTADGEDLLHAWFVSLKKEKAIFEKLFLAYQQQTSRRLGCEPCATPDPCCEPPTGGSKTRESGSAKRLDIPITEVRPKGNPSAGSCGCR